MTQEDYNYNIIGVDNLNMDTDPLLVGMSTPKDIVDCRNIDMNKNTLRLRNRMESAFDLNTEYFKTSGVFFPDGAKAVLPLTKTYYYDSFYMANNDAVDDDNSRAFIIDFWLKVKTVLPFDRYVFRIKHPHHNGSDDDVENYMSLKLEVEPNNKNKAYLKFQMCYTTGEGDTAVANLRSIDVGGYTDTNWEFTCNNKWTRVTIGKTTAGAIVLYLNGVATASYSTLTNFLPHNTQLLYSGCTYVASEEPLCYNSLWIGEGGNMSISEMRFLRYTKLENLYVTDIVNWISNTSTELDPNNLDSHLVLYIPFNEGYGKTFTELINTITGFLTPQEPFINNDNHLLFTGDDCVARPSWGCSDKLNPHQLDTMDGEEDLNPAFIVAPDLKYEEYDTTYHYQNLNDWSVGTYQLRIKLKGLKEGCLIGNVWLIRGTTGYYIGIKKPSNGNTAAGGQYKNDKITHDIVVDETWVDVEKTITISIDTNSALTNYEVKLYVDDTEYTLDDVSVYPSGSYHELTFNTLLTGTSFDYSVAVPGFKGGDLTTCPWNGYTKPMIAGHEADVKYCLPFELIFFRSWLHHIISQTGVENTYNQEDLGPYYKVFIEGLPAWLDADTLPNSVMCKLYDNKNVFMTGSWDDPDGLDILKIPLTYNTELDNMDGNDFSFQLDPKNDEEIRWDIMIQSVTDASSYSANIVKFIDHTSGHVDSYEADEAKENLFLFNGMSFVRVASWYNSNTFKDNQEQRYEYLYEIDDGWYDSSKWGQLKSIISLFDVVVSDSDAQGYRKNGVINKKTRYLMLGTQTCFVNIYDVYSMLNKEVKSLRSHWVYGPVKTQKPPVIRGIYQYISEDNSINKILMVAHCNIYSYDYINKTLTIEDGSIENYDNEIVNFVVLNNKLVIMDSHSAIKLNYKNNWSRLGIERPSRIVAEVFPSSEQPTNIGTWHDTDHEYHFAYVAQNYDEENNAYSGTLPIFPSRKQGIQFIGDDLSGTGLLASFIIVSSSVNLDDNVKQQIIYRTLDLNGDGDAADLYTIAIIGMNKFRVDTENIPLKGNDAVYTQGGYVDTNSLQHNVKRRLGNVYQDIWDDTQLLNNTLGMLPIRYTGVSTIPNPAKAIGVIQKRLWTGNYGKDGGINVYMYSDVDSLGIGTPDIIPEINAGFLTDTSPNEITAIYSAIGKGLIFQKNSLYEIIEPIPERMSIRLVANNIGCINQRCVTKVGDDIYFLSYNGLYKYHGGYPILVTAAIRSFFKGNVNKTEMESSFIVYESDYNKLRCYVPSTKVNDGDNCCDTCIVLDLITNKITFEDVPDLVCGAEIYSNGYNHIYLGSKWGLVYKISNDGKYVEGLDNQYTPTNVTVSTKTVTQSLTNWPTGRYGLYGLPLFLVKVDDDAKYLQIWKGIISEINTNNTLVVNEWIPLFNTDSDPANGTYDYIVIGGIYYYVKTPIYNFPEAYYEKLLRRIDFYHNKMDYSGNYQFKLSLNFLLDHARETHKYKLDLWDGKDTSFATLFNERHRFCQLEIAGVSFIELDIKTISFKLKATQSKLERSYTA